MQAERGDFTPFFEKMTAAGLAPVVIDTFRHYYTELMRGATGQVSARDIEPVDGLPRFEELDDSRSEGREALHRTVMIKLNGGLGTSMGLERAKSLLPVKDGLRFLDIIVRQVLHVREVTGARLPLLFMDSYNTADDTLEALAAYPELKGDLPLDFLQHKIPKILAETGGPVSCPDHPDLEWCPPGHGNIYTALVTTGLLEGLRVRGYRYAFLSNADNLGAVMEVNILGWFAKAGLPFLMEVADRTGADRKGGHLARRKDGRLMLRESAQCPPGEEEEFQDIARHRYFNTNNLWIDLDALDSALARHGQVLPLPLIRNVKTLDPRDLDTPPVYLLETALGAAIEVFEGAEALRVPRSRFAPVKTTDDLLALWSDVFVIREDYSVVRNPRRTLPTIFISLDPSHYRRIDQLRKHFPQGPPSLVDCASLRVEGEVTFGADVTVRGDVVLRGSETPRIEDGAVLGG